MKAVLFCRDRERLGDGVFNYTVGIIPKEDWDRLHGPGDDDVDEQFQAAPGEFEVWSENGPTLELAYAVAEKEAGVMGYEIVERYSLY